jgi:LacI family transcriptional regulator
MKDDDSIKPAGIKEIAALLGISIGTVDRALHNRAGVSAETRQRVLKTAERFHYKPNLAARNLKLNRYLKIAVFLPREISSFFDALRAGIQAAQAEASASIELSFFSYPRLGEGDIRAMEKADWRKFDGLIVAPGNSTNWKRISRIAKEQSKPIVFVATDAPHLHRIASVAVDAGVSGSVAAELLGHFVQKQGTVAAFIGDLRIEDHATKLGSFASSLAAFSPHLALLPAVEAHDSEKDAYRAALRLIEKHPKLAGIYIGTANSMPVMQALREKRRLGRVCVVATDLFPEMVSLIEGGHIAATIYQRPSTQGRLAFDALRAYFLHGTVPQPIHRLAPHIVLRSNLSMFHQTA